MGDNSVIKGRLGWKNLKHEEYTVSGPSMVSGRYIESGEIDWQSVDHIPEWRYEESPEIMLQNGDIIFTKDGSRLGNPAVISNLQIKATINSTMMLVRTDKTISPYFLYQVLRGSLFERLIHQKVSGSGIPHLFQVDMNKFIFKSPTIAEQSLVSELLSRLDATIASNQQQ
ncbi:restriction endonuclease subunit S [Levilactobacillus zymae]|uniref:restriction endonuclease subunit S n=1 Tax=Levilactobacillus zymae TaxID=267363 RepID=UPI001F2E2D1A